MSKEYRVKEQKYKHGSLFLPQYRVFSIWINLPLISNAVGFLSSMEEAIKVIEKDIEKEKEQKIEETIIHNYPLRPKENG
jgi:hypothetical protein